MEPTSSLRVIAVGKSNFFMADSRNGIKADAFEKQPRIAYWSNRSAGAETNKQYFILLAKSREQLITARLTLVKLKPQYVKNRVLTPEVLRSEDNYVTVKDGQEMFTEMKMEDFIKCYIPKYWAMTPEQEESLFVEGYPHRAVVEVNIPAELADCGMEEKGKGALNSRRNQYFVVVSSKDDKFDTPDNVVSRQDLIRSVTWSALTHTKKSKTVEHVRDPRVGQRAYQWDFLFVLPLRTANQSARRKQRKLVAKMLAMGIEHMAIEHVRTSRANQNVRTIEEIKQLLAVCAAECAAVRSVAREAGAPMYSVQSFRDLMGTGSISSLASAVLGPAGAIASSEMYWRQRYLRDASCHALAVLPESPHCGVVVQIHAKLIQRMFGLDNNNAKGFNRGRFVHEFPHSCLIFDKKKDINASMFVNGEFQEPGETTYRLCVLRYVRNVKSKTKLTMADMHNAANYAIVCYFGKKGNSFGINFMEHFADAKIEQEILAMAVVDERGQIMHCPRFEVRFRGGAVAVDPRPETGEHVSPFFGIFFRCWMSRTYQHNRKVYHPIVRSCYPTIAAVTDFNEDVRRRKRTGGDLDEDPDSPQSDECEQSFPSAEGSAMETERVVIAQQDQDVDVDVDVDMCDAVQSSASGGEGSSSVFADTAGALLSASLDELHGTVQKRKRDDDDCAAGPSQKRRCEEGGDAQEEGHSDTAGDSAISSTFLDLQSPISLQYASNYNYGAPTPVSGDDISRWSRAPPLCSMGAPADENDWIHQDAEVMATRSHIQAALAVPGKARELVTTMHSAMMILHHMIHNPL